MNQIEFKISKLNRLVNLLFGGIWMNLEKRENLFNENNIPHIQTLFENKMPLDLIEFYKKHGPFKSEGFICPMDLRLNSKANASIGLVDELNAFFGSEYFQETEETKIINKNYKCVGKMWLGDESEEIHSFFYDIENSQYGRFYHHQDNGQDIDNFGLKSLLNRNKKFETMESLISNEIKHLRTYYLASNYECYGVKDLQAYLDSVVEMDVFDSILSYIFSLDHQPWSGIDKKVSKVISMFSKEEIIRLNDEFKTVGWYLNENDSTVVFIGKNMADVVFDPNDLESLSQSIGNIHHKEKESNLSEKLDGINEFNCICR